MTSGFLRITVGAPLIALAMLAFSVVLLVEWLGDLSRTCPHPEKDS
jgi:hypothetical protein